MTTVDTNTPKFTKLEEGLQKLEKPDFDNNFYTQDADLGQRCFFGRLIRLISAWVPFARSFFNCCAGSNLQKTSVALKDKIVTTLKETSEMQADEKKGLISRVITAFNSRVDHFNSKVSDARKLKDDEVKLQLADFYPEEKPPVDDSKGGSDKSDAAGAAGESTPPAGGAGEASGSNPAAGASESTPPAAGTSPTDGAGAPANSTTGSTDASTSTSQPPVEPPAVVHTPAAAAESTGSASSALPSSGSSSDAEKQASGTNSRRPSGRRAHVTASGATGTGSGSRATTRHHAKAPAATATTAAGK